MPDDLRLEVRLRNNTLWHLVFDGHRSVVQFCAAHGQNQVTVGNYLNLTSSPYAVSGSGRLTRGAQALCDLSGLSREELFPPGLYAGTSPSRGAAEIDSRRFVSLAAAKRLASPETATDAVFAVELHAALTAAVATLPPDQQRVITMRFGLADGVEHTLDAVAQTIPNKMRGGRYRGRPVSRERIRQIEARAVGNLRRVRPLKQFT